MASPFDPSDMLQGTASHQRLVQLFPSHVTDFQAIPQEWWVELQRVLEFETGMDLAGSRGSRLRDAVASVVRRSDKAFASIFSDNDLNARFVESVAAELTIGESFFLRNENHMQALRKIVLPKILEENATRRTVRCWSAGCAGGEEPYSLAILLDELVDKATPWQISILATDLNPAFLDRGREALYRPWSFRQTNVFSDQRFFVPEGNAYRVREHLRRQVRFSYLNLVKDVYPSALNGILGLDLILFRNVAIYLKQDVTLAILQRLYRALRPGGWLLLGETEVTLAPDVGFEVHRHAHVTLHRKPMSSEPDLGTFVPVRSEHSPVLPRVDVKVPVLPEWVPLPKKQEEVQGDHRQTSAPKNSEAAGHIDWQQRIDRITDRRERGEQRLVYVKTLLQLAQLLEARSELDLCLRDHPLSVEAHLLQAGLLEEAGNLVEAEKAYRRALYLDRNSAITHFHLGLVQAQRGDLPGSRRSLKTADGLAEKADPRELVEHGDGVCYGRLREMIQLMTGERNE
ncbi:CheR family methyltransferase [Planctomicrobium sp. SH661]|uniref:CheR family methyltransferase n=1 Tax=Planctomicrobium sp. SH661 TaxID=3448124 RepID=UPI003F5CA011